MMGMSPLLLFLYPNKEERLQLIVVSLNHKSISPSAASTYASLSLALGYLKYNIHAKTPS